jgi:uncharacterized membrane protein YtjA (UPF0391 family)
LPDASWGRPVLPTGPGHHNTQEPVMFSWAIVFLVVALIAAVLGFTGIAGTAVNIAWILFVVGLILFIVFAILGRRGGV